MNKKYLISSLIALLIVVLAGSYYFYKNKTNNDDDSPWLDAYYHGDYKKAAEILMHLAEKGDPIAQFNLGMLYIKGLGVSTNFEKGLNLIEQSAKHNNIAALTQLGNVYSLGISVNRNYQKAIAFYQKAIAFSEKTIPKDGAFAKYNLALMYLNGYGVEKNLRTSKKLLYESADLGNVYAINNIATNYLKGIDGFQQNNRKAFFYMKKAAKAGNPVSQSNLGVMYKIGKGIKQDLEKAYKWFYIAAHYDNEKSKYNINELDSRLTKEQKALAIKEAKEWMKNYKEINLDLVNAEPR